NLNIKNKGPTVMAYFDSKHDPSINTKCCSGGYANDKVYNEVCNYLGYTGEGPKCDLVVDEYCPSHLDDPLCSCYNTAASISKLPTAMQQYAVILEAQPKCWLKDCALKGYHNLRMR